MTEEYEWEVERIIYWLSKLLDHLREYRSYISNEEGQLYINPFLILTGKGGIGKTHSLTHFALTKIRKGFPLVMLFGHNFHNKKLSIWQQIENQLKLPRSLSSHLGLLQLLQQAGESKHVRALIIIDALNESSPPNLWKEYLPAFYGEIKKYPNVALAVSVRRGFEENTLPKGIEQKFIMLSYHGFDGLEKEALERFAQHYEIPLGQIPLFISRFRNPLFLHLFCKSVNNPNRIKKNKETIRAHEGLTYLFESYIKKNAKEICRTLKLNCSNKREIWHFIKTITEHMVEKQKMKLNERETMKIAKRFFPPNKIHAVLKELDTRTILERIPNYSTDFKRIENYSYRFPFQTLNNHLVVRYILNKCKEKCRNQNDIQKFFSEPTIRKLILSNYGILEALAIQVPERFKGKELHDIAPYVKKNMNFVDAFTQSIALRKPTAFNKRTVAFLRDILENKVIDFILEENEKYDRYFVYQEDIFQLLESI